MALYASIHTTLGLREIARAEATSSQINLVEMVFGDGGGNPVEVSETMIQLVRERYRTTINRIYQNPDDSTQFIVEGIIPASVGGWTAREGGVIDSNGNLFIVSKLPDSYQPLPSEGAFSDTTQRLVFQALNADSVTLIVDPNVSVATQSWVINYTTGGNVFPGGTTGQILTKTGNADGQAEWRDPDGITVSADVIEEPQVLAAGQTVVDLALTTTRGLAIYIEGLRLRRDQWTPDPDVDTRLTLATSYPAGTRFTAAQNEPTGNAPTPLERDKNLSDVANKAQARANLDVPSRAEANRAGPIGMPARWPTGNIPTGWVIRNGAALSRSAYPELFAVLGTAYGAGDGFNTFNVPQDCGGFDGNADMGRGLDPVMTVGAWLTSQNKDHFHTGRTRGAGAHNHRIRRGTTNAQGNPGQGGEEISKADRFVTEFYTDSVEDHEHDFETSRNGGTHARPNVRAYVPIMRAY